jgi:hypothetical protein
LHGVVSRYGTSLADGALVSCSILDPDGTRRLLSRAAARKPGELFVAYKLTLLEAWYAEVESWQHR